MSGRPHPHNNPTDTACRQPPLWLYLHFPTLQLDLLCDNEPAHDMAQVASAPVKPPARHALPLVLINEQHQVNQANALAQQAGIKTGMSLAQACALAADLQVRAWQAGLEQQQLQQIAQQLYQYIADIALAPPTALWIRLDPMLKLYKTLPDLLAKLWQPLDALGLHYQAGLAPTAAAARLFALSEPPIRLTDVKQLVTQLAPLPIKLLPVPTELLQQLNRLGIERLGQWLNLPTAELARRFPQQLATLRQELLGEQATPLQFIQPASSFTRSLELLWHTEQQQQLLAPLQLLLRQLQQFLQRGNRRCSSTRLLLHIPDGQDLTLQISAPKPLQLQQHWFALWQQKLSNLQLTGSVSRLTLDANDFCQQPAESPDLLAHYAGNTDPYQLFALLQARLGEEKVRHPGFYASWLPQQANLVSRHAVLNADDRSEPLALLLPATLRSAQNAPRPAFLYPTALPLPDGQRNSVSAGAAHLLQALKAPVQLQPGTERINSQWWLDNSHTVDYRIGYSPNGQWLWLCREAGGAWQLQGLFA